MTARLSRELAGANAIAAETQSLRDDLALLCDQDPRTYLGVIAARRSPPTPDPADRTNRITAALSEAAAVPMTVLEAGARLARLAAELAEEGNPNLRGDAVVAAVLAGAGAEAAAALVRINLAGRPGDDRLVLARTLLDETGAWVERARRTVPD
jgi:formiminotetrahydrofolate cyclodeaminase